MPTSPLHGVADGTAAGDDLLRVALAFVDDFYSLEQDAHLLTVHDGSTETDRSSGARDSASTTTPDPLDTHTQTPSLRGGSLLPTHHREQLSDVALPSLMPSLTPSSRPSVQPAPRRKRSNKRVELIQLRTTVQELELRLELLTRNTRAGVSTDRGMARQPTPRSSNAVEDSHTIWKDVARRQREQRTASELTRASLLRIITEKRQVVAHMEQYLSVFMRKMHIPSPHTSPPIKLMVLQDQLNPLDDPKVISELMADLEVMHGSVSSAFSDIRFQTPPPHRTIELRGNESVGRSMGVLDICMFPSDWQTTADILWHNAISTHGLKYMTSYVVPTMDDTVIQSFEGQVNFPNATLRCKMKIAMRRIMQLDRVVVIASLLMQPFAISTAQVPLDGTLIRHHAWHVLRPALQLQDGQDCATLSQLHHVSTPKVLDKMAPHQHAFTIDTLLDFETNTIGLQIDFRHQFLENCLLNMRY